MDKLTEKSINLEQLIDSVKEGLLNNPPICELLAFIEREKLISDHELKIMTEQLQVQLNLLCLFEAFAVTMVNSFTFNEDIYNFTKKQRNTFYPGNPINNFFFCSNKNNSSLFKSLKLVSVDPVITEGAFIRALGDEELSQEELVKKSEEFIRQHGLALWNAKICPPPLGQMQDDSVKNVSLNILSNLGRTIHQGWKTG